MFQRLGGESEEGDSAGGLPHTVAVYALWRALAPLVEVFGTLLSVVDAIL
jgi:hypothetical protein